MKIGNRHIGDGNPCFIIGEIGSNQNKDLSTAYKLIDMAAEAGVDAIKFQTMKPNDITIRETSANTYGEYSYTKGKKYWYEVLEELVIPFEWHKELFDYATSKGLIAFSTPESVEAVDLLEELNVPLYKMASMDITHVKLLERIGKTKKPVIISSGIASDIDIIKAIDILKRNGTEEIALLHCVSDYPPKYDYMSLELIPYYKRLLNIPIGFSDHCEENLLDGVAVALGACIVEKHITLDKSSEGPDHSFAMDKEGVKDLVKTIRIVEKALPISKLLKGRKNEKKVLYGRSIVSNKKISANSKVTINDVEFKRPGNGILPENIDIINGLTLKHDVGYNHVFTWDDFK